MSFALVVAVGPCFYASTDDSGRSNRLIPARREQTWLVLVLPTFGAWSYFVV